MDKILRNTVVPVPEGQADEYESVEKEEVEGKLGELELVRADIHIEDGEIAAIQPAGNGAGVEANEDVETFDVDHGLVLPGGVDVHVHFREPGATHKEDWLSGSESAAAGGVTTVVDQPNTDPPTVTGEAFDVKRERAENSIVDYGINAGVTEDWKPEELFQRPVAAYGEVFMADSTGNMGISTERFAEAVREIQDQDELVTVHAEDSGEFECMELEEPEDWARNRRPEAEVEAVKKAIEVADDPIHFCHVSHPDSVEAIADTQHTLEVTPHHLFLSRDDFDEKGTYVKMNPPLRSEEARQRLWKLIDDVDAVATDHAPHTVDEKEEHVGEAPAGVPGVETLVPLMLAKVLEGEITLENFIDLTGRRPAEIFDFRSKGRIEEGLDADLYVTDLDTTKVDGDELHSRAGWTPFEGLDAVFPRLVLRRGETIYDGEVKKSKGKLVS